MNAVRPDEVASGRAVQEGGPVRPSSVHSGSDASIPSAAPRRDLTPNTASHMESSVTRLLVATKMLLEALTQWSHGACTESHVSVIYVRLGNDFNAALAAFAGYGIDMSDMYSVPADLRACLETCLSEPATTATLEQHLPRIRDIIVRLLHGLKAKQASYKQLAMQRTPEPAEVRPPVPSKSGEVGASRGLDEVPTPPPGARPMGTPLPFLGRRAVSKEASVPLTPVVVPASPSQPAEAGEGVDEVNLRALRKSDALERRASKRFSAYAFNKMGVGAAWQPTSSPRTPDRAAPSQRSSGAEALSPVQEPAETSTAEKPALLEPPARAEEAPPASTATSLPLFIQLGRATRKVHVALEPSAPARGLSIAQLRMLFVDEFAYSPGMDDFPEIYIKDPQSGVQYQLDDMSDIQPRCLLTLNIEPLDQVKQHLDLSLTGVTRELRELKALLREHGPHELPKHDAQRSLGIPDAAFHAAGVRISSASHAPHPAGGSALADELKAQYDLLQTLRGDLAVLRQVHGEGEQDMRTLFASLRAEVHEVEKVTSLGPSAGRNLVETGRAKLDAHSQEVLTTVEDLQDMVEDLKQDVSHRGVKPKPGELPRLAHEIQTATARLEALEQFIHTVKPAWKKTWEAELQNIVDEQEFLHYQEGLLADLRQDHAALQGVFANVEQVVKLRKVSGSDTDGPSRTQRYIPPPPDAEHEGIGTVMIEVRGQAIDHDRRLRAVQAAERARGKAQHGQKDEFASELAGFVDQRALRKTGGHREVERVRQKRDKDTLRTMLSPPPRQGSADRAVPDDAPSSHESEHESSVIDHGEESTGIRAQNA